MRQTGAGARIRLGTTVVNVSIILRWAKQCEIGGAANEPAYVRLVSGVSTVLQKRLVAEGHQLPAYGAD